MDTVNFPISPQYSSGEGGQTQSPAAILKPVENGMAENHNGVSHKSHGSKDGHKHSSSSNKDKHHSSSSKHHSSSSKHHSSSSKDKHHSSSSSKDKSSSSSKDKHHSSSKHHHSSSKDKHHSSSSSKHKEGSSSSKKVPGQNEVSSLSKHHKDGSSSSKKVPGQNEVLSSPSKHHKDGSSSSKKVPGQNELSSPSKHHKDGSSSSKKVPGQNELSSPSKHHSSSSKDKHHSSSSSKDKSSSSSKDKHHSPLKHHSSSSKHHHSSSKDKQHSSSSSKHKDAATPKEEPVKLIVPKQEVKEVPVMVEIFPKEDHNEPMDIVPKEEPMEESDEDDIPLSERTQKIIKKENESPTKESPKKVSPLKRKFKEEDDNYDDYAPEKKKKKKNKEAKNEKVKKEVKKEGNKQKKDAVVVQGKKKGKKEPKEEEEKYKWWEEISQGKRDDNKKWEFLEHQGPIFAPPYEVLPSNVRFFYNHKPMKLAPETEEVSTFYARMLDHDYTSQQTFNDNFFKDWRKVMKQEEKEKLKDLSLCNFKEIGDYFKEQSEIRKNKSKEDKKKLKEQNAEIQEEYGFCMMDGHKEKIGNFKIEPPGLFRGRGNHPKMGMLKKRTRPEDVIINCSKGAKVPDPPEGHKWKEIRHDNTVTWLACWNENIQGSTKYVMLNAASRLKGEKDWQKYETARKLHKCVDRIRANYRDDWKSKEMRLRQRAVALYFIDKLALRAGNEKDEDTADTVGCCSVRVEHITLTEKMSDMENVVEFDFLGKDSIRYYNKVSVEKRVFKNLQLFSLNKAPGDDLFDRLNTGILNKYLQSLMDGLTAKVFRTFNASKTLQEQLKLLTNPDDPIPAKLLSYNRANRAVAVLCNHQRAVPKNFEKQMENLQTKIDSKKDQIKVAKKDLKAAKADYKATHTDRARKMVEVKKKAIDRHEEQLTKLEVQATDKDENKEIALGTSKLNYLDPRISVGWCKKWEVPIEKIYNKTQRDKFAWAIEMADEDYEF